MRYMFEIHDEYISNDEMESFFDEFIPVIENKIEAIFYMGFSEGISVIMSTGYENDRFVLSPVLNNSVEKALDAGRMFNGEELQSGACVAVACDDVFEGADVFVVDGEAYKRIGTIKGEVYSNTMYVPYKAVPDDCEIVYFSINLTKPLLETEYNAMASLIRKYIGNKVDIPQFDGIKNTSFVRVYNDLIVVTVVLVFVCAVNYCIIYRYILEKRRKTFAISRICGCTRAKATAIYMIELLSISLITLGVGVIIYLKFFMPKAVKYFEYIEYYHTFQDNMQVAIIYIVALFITYFVLVVRYVSASPANLLRGCD